MNFIHTLAATVILPTHTTSGLFERSLSSILALNPPPEEIIVVFDGAREACAWQPADPRIRLLFTGAQRGPAAARNLGAREAAGDLLVFFDADVLVPPNSIARFQQVFKQHPEISGAIGSYDEQPGDARFFSQYKNLFHHYTHQQARAEASTFWGACGAVRRAAFLQVGGFDERFRVPSIEDIELGYRLVEAGYPLRLCKDIQVKHLKSWSFASMTKVDFWQRALPWSRLILSRGRMVNDLNLKTSARWSVALTCLLLGSLAGGLFWQGLFAAAGLCALALLALNLPIHRFFAQKRGFWFALAGVPLLWFYYLYSGAAFLLAFLQTKVLSQKVGGKL